MANKYALIGCSGIIVSVLCLTAAGLIAGNSFQGEGRSQWRHALRSLFHGRDSCPVPSGGSGTRSIAWHGGNSIEISMSSTVHYRAGEGDAVVVTGDNALIQHVKVDGNEVRMDCNYDGDALTVTLPGREFRKIEVSGAGDVVLENINQRRLELSVVGAGDLRASGKLEHLELSVVGAGDAQLGELVSEDGEVNVVGSGDVALAVTGELELNLIGAGDVTLHREPRRLQSNVIGAGEIKHSPDPVSPETPAMPASPDAAKPVEKSKGI
jgi:hypothetical protein